MSDAVPSYGFTAARRGYAPEQVDHAMAALTAQRDGAWQRLSELGTRLRELETRLEEALQAAADAPEPDYTTLSEQAAGLLAIADNEARAVREKAQRFAEDARDGTDEAGRALAEAAAEYAAATRAEADLAARRTEEHTRAEAGKLRGEADREARELRDAATAEAARMRVAAAEAGERAEAKLAELRREADERFATEETAAVAEEAKIAAVVERRLKEAEQHRETVLGLIKQIDTDAQARADQLVEQARREAERINAASAQEQVEFAKRQETVQTHLDHIKGTLASLTGKAVGMIEPDTNAPAPAPAMPGPTPAAAVPGPAPAPAGQGAPTADSEADTGELAVPASARESRTEDSPTTVLRLPAERVGGPAPAPWDARPAAPVDPRTALRVAASGNGAVPPRPATPPPTHAPQQAPDVPEAETAIIPKIVIIDDGVELDSLPNTVGRRRT